MFEQQGDVRWGTFAVTGTWDGTAFTVTDAIPGALYDPAMPEEPPVTRSRPTAYTDAELEQIAEELRRAPRRPGRVRRRGPTATCSSTSSYDDGSLQDWADDDVRRRTS